MTGTAAKGRVLVTGATGFIGRALVSALAADGFSVRAAIRTPVDLPDGVESAVVGDLRRPVNLTEAFRDVDLVVHSAGLAHAGKEISDETYKAINSGVTEALAAAARQAKVRRFVLLSSVRAQTGPTAEDVLTEASPAAPTDAYGRSKLEGEETLRQADVPFVILRPVVVHGHGMRFNMAELLKLAQSGWPVPFGGIKARRSVLAREHLAEAVRLSLVSDAMAGETYVVADGDPLTPGEIVAAMRKAWNRRPGVFPLPSPLISAAAGLTRRREQLDRLRQPLVVDAAKLRAAGWRPREGTAEAITATARSYG